MGKFAWDIKAKHCWVVLKNILLSKVCWQHPAMLCLYTSNKFFPPIIWIFTEGEGNWNKSRLPFKISTTFLLPFLMKINSRIRQTMVWITDELIYIKIHAMSVRPSFFLTPFPWTNLRAKYIFLLTRWRYSDHFKVNRWEFVLKNLFIIFWKVSFQTWCHVSFRTWSWN